MWGVSDRAVAGLDGDSPGLRPFIFSLPRQNRSIFPRFPSLLLLLGSEGDSQDGLLEDSAFQWDLAARGFVGGDLRSRKEFRLRRRNRDQERLCRLSIALLLER